MISYSFTLRNFLHGRSGADSLLGRSEMERIFPRGEVTIFISTWNMNGQVRNQIADIVKFASYNKFLELALML